MNNEELKTLLDTDKNAIDSIINDTKKMLESSTRNQFFENFRLDILQTDLYTFSEGKN